MSSRVQTAVTMRQVTGSMANVVRGMDSAMKSMDLEKVRKWKIPLPPGPFFYICAPRHCPAELCGQASGRASEGSGGGGGGVGGCYCPKKHKLSFAFAAGRDRSPT